MQERKTMKIGGIRIAGMLMLSSVLSSGGSAFAQDGTPVDEPQAGVGDIIVTARRREESLQTVPVAVAAFSAGDLRDRSIGSIADLSASAPNLFVSSGPSGGGATAAFFIRGIGQTDFIATVDPGVAVYLDGVYLSRATGNVLDLVTPERVEVLRGPQGTLFGRNTIGGAISVTSRRPADTFGLELDVTYGSYDRFEIKGRVDMPLAEGLGSSLTVSRQRRDGYGRSLANGEEFGNRDVWAGRFDVEWAPDDRFNLLLAADYTRRDERATVHSVSAIDEADANFPALQAYDALLASPAPPNGFGTPLLISSPTCPGASPATTSCGYAFTAADPYDNLATGPNESYLRVWGVSAIAEIRLDPFTIRSITAYRDQRDRQGIDFDSSPLELSEQRVRTSSRQFSQELQFLGKAFGDRLDWLVGLYYSNDESRTQFDAAFLQPGFGPRIALDSTLKSDSYAVFGSATLAITDTLKLTVGARYSRDEKRIAGTADFPFNPFLMGAPSSIFAAGQIPIPGGSIPAFLPAGTTRQLSRTWEDFAPKASIEWRASSDIFLYASVARGYKSGSFLGRPLTGAAGYSRYEPETVTAYEIGAKLDLLDRRLRINAAVFQSDYDDIQLTVIVPEGVVVNTPTVNAGKARIRGAELEVILVPADGLRLDGSLGYTDAQFRRLNPPADFPNATLPFTTDATFAQTPEWTASAGAQYRLALGDIGSVTLRGDMRYRSRIIFGLPNVADASDPGLTLFNARLTWEAPREDWSIAVFGTNLTKEVYKTFAFGAFGLVTSYYGQPREFGVAVRKRF
jgi:iron complex outermembrane receptor protein